MYVNQHISSLEDATTLFEVETNEIEGINNDIARSQHSTDGSDSDVGSPYDFYENDYDEDSYNPQGQSTAVSKVQIKLNNLINNCKAPLKLHNDSVVLFNDYIASPNFDLNAKMKTRKSFILSMESSYGVTHLRPMNTEVMLHDQSRVTVPVFDAKSMILDLLTDQNLMINANIAEGYNIFSGDVDLNNPSNQKYSEVHTGDEWLPARDRYCSSPDDIHNDMPVALIIFGDKLHTDLHGALALTPIIFTLTLFNRMSRTIPSFGDLLHIFRILVLKRTRLKKLLLRIKYKTNMSVSLLHSNQLDKSIVREVSEHQCWAGK